MIFLSFAHFSLMRFAIKNSSYNKSPQKALTKTFWNLQIITPLYKFFNKTQPIGNQMKSQEFHHYLPMTFQELK